MAHTDARDANPRAGRSRRARSHPRLEGLCHRRPPQQTAALRRRKDARGRDRSAEGVFRRHRGLRARREIRSAARFDRPRRSRPVAEPLDEYYNGEGAASPIRIALPRGGYAAVLRAVEAPPAGRGRRRRWPRIRQPRRSRAAIPARRRLARARSARWSSGSAAGSAAAADDQHPAVAVLAFDANMAGDDNSSSRRD